MVNKTNQGGTEEDVTESNKTESNKTMCSLIVVLIKSLVTIKHNQYMP